MIAGLIARARNADLLATATTLGARLKRATATEYAGPCPVCGGRDRFSVNTKRRIWHCRGCGTGGGVVDLMMHVRGCDFRQAVEILTGSGSMLVPQARPKPPAPPPKSEPDNKAFIARTIADIVWQLAPIRGTPGEQNLADARKIDTDAIADVLERTDAIGWHPAVLFREQGHPLDGKQLGCIVGVMTDPVTAKSTGAISRTYLHGGLKVGKAKTLGQPAGIVRLTPDDEVLGGLHLAEGLESALDAMAKGFRPMWSTGSTSLMASFPVLAGIECLTIFADHDANEAGLKAASEAASRWQAAGHETHVYQRETLGDFNDAFREARR